MRVTILLALVGAVFSRDAQPTPGTRIVGGSPTTVETYPFMANLQYLTLGIFWTNHCGGTLITSRTVLTAATCVLNDSPSFYRVRLGSSLAASGGTTHRVQRITIHDQYDVPEMMDNDVAIVHLATPAVLSEAVRPARIAGNNYILPDGTVTTAIGWGTLSADSETFPAQLQHVDINLINQELCAERYAYLRTQPGFEDFPQISESMICAGILDVGGKNACQLDTGGPLVHQGDILIGIVSWRYGCADPLYPGVYFRVSHLSDWIVEKGSV